MIRTAIELASILQKIEGEVIIVAEDDVLDFMEEHGAFLAKTVGIKSIRVQKSDPEGIVRTVLLKYEEAEKELFEGAAKVAAKLATISLKSVKNNVKNGVLTLVIDGNSFEIKEEWLDFKIKTPEGYKAIPFSKGYVYYKNEKENP